MPTKMSSGPLSDRDIRPLTEGSKPSIKIDQQFIQPSSVDIPIGSTVYQVASEPTLAINQNIKDFIRDNLINTFNLTKSNFVTVSPNQTYITECDFELNLPGELFGYANPKSSTGRNFIHSKIVCDSPDGFDRIPNGYRGKIYTVLTSRKFFSQIHPGDTISQIRFFYGKRQFVSGLQLKHIHRDNPLVTNPGLEPVFDDEGLVLHVNLGLKPSNLVAVTTGRPIIVTKKKILDIHDFFREKPLGYGRLYLELSDSVLLTTKELVRIPIDMCAEMTALDPQYGEVRSHDAGFFDPGFGINPDNLSVGNSVVCEVTNLGPAAIQIVDGQPISKLRYENLTSLPLTRYGLAGNHYQDQQGIRPSKNFRWPPESALL